MRSVAVVVPFGIIKFLTSLAYNTASIFLDMGYLCLGGISCAELAEYITKKNWLSLNKDSHWPR